MTGFIYCYFTFSQQFAFKIAKIQIYSEITTIIMKKIARFFKAKQHKN